MRKFIYFLLFIVSVDVYAEKMQMLDSTYIHTPTETIYAYLFLNEKNSGASSAAEFDNGREFIKNDKLTNDQWKVINSLIERYQSTRGDTYSCLISITWRNTMNTKYMIYVIIEYIDSTKFNWWAYRF